jgi:ferrous iron transport protein B
MGGLAGVGAASLTVAGIVMTGVAVTLLTAWFLSKTLLKGVPSTFALELSPYRLPQIGRTIIRSLLDRTVIILTRAVLVAAPAGGLVWVLANVRPGEHSILVQGAGLLQPLGKALGLDGFILLSFILGLPANEIVLPILLMSYLSVSSMVEPDNLLALKMLLVNGQGWTWLTALCTMLFSLLHFPCGTTLFTIWRETKSAKWTGLAIIIPFMVASMVCFAINWTIRTLGLI